MKKNSEDYIDSITHSSRNHSIYKARKKYFSRHCCNDISSKYTIPVDVQGTLKVACNDCHTNNSRYPWYWNIQPSACSLMVTSLKEKDI